MLTQEEIRELSTKDALYLGIAKSWNFEFEAAKSIFETKLVQTNDFRLRLGLKELILFEVIITGSKKLIEASSLDVEELEE